MPAPVDHEEARLRLRYDVLAEDTPNLLAIKASTWDAADPIDGITNHIEEELCVPDAPVGSINVKSRAIWRKCVRDRADLPAADLSALRTKDIALAHGWLASQEFSEETVNLVQEFYGLGRKQDYANGPLGGRKPDGWLPKGQRTKALKSEAPAKKGAGKTRAAAKSAKQKKAPTGQKRRQKAAEMDTEGSDDSTAVTKPVTRSKRAKLS
ncbi:uncharacterized protein FIBRA_00039 [Fibroporia radiculosa]|uniref:Uncharacterized protein n=1 Tax=Fibroporia radiculosa TaxID=599839 RepID=J7RUQ3_9APHY|nr:uncharacterized protein FIBRA_00039 [Fibroporia radiculosa]CCL98045.1 predicted protein [Fibroporia radiculosa]